MPVQEAEGTRVRSLEEGIRNKLPVFRSQRDKLCVGFIDSCLQIPGTYCAQDPKDPTDSKLGHSLGMKLPSSRQVTMIIYLFFRLADGFPKSLLTRASKMGRHPLNT